MTSLPLPLVRVQYPPPLFLHKNSDDHDNDDLDEREYARNDCAPRSFRGLEFFQLDEDIDGNGDPRHTHPESSEHVRGYDAGS